jgi:hypothetical protein
MASATSLSVWCAKRRALGRLCREAITRGKKA